jgi:tetratricopeptide (TPR) repeat protein
VIGANWKLLDSLARVVLIDQPDNVNARVRAASALAAFGRVHDAMHQLDPLNRFGNQWQLILASASGAALDPAAQQVRPTSPVTQHAFVTLWAAAAGDTTRARSMLVGFRSLTDDQRSYMRGGARQTIDTALVLCEAWLAAAAGQAATVVELLRPIAEDGTGGVVWVNMMKRWTLAEAYEQLGQLDSATVWLEPFARWHGYHWGSESDFRGFTHSFAHFKLGRLYAQLGNVEEAREHFTTFLDDFSEPDPEYVWMVTEARARLGQLGRS